MPGSVLYFVYLAVMAAAFLCFLQAYRRRLLTPVHKRWALAGTALSLGGVGIVLAGAELLGWSVDIRYPDVVWAHRRIAIVAIALLIVTATSGMLRLPFHKRLYVVFLPLYAAALLLAVIGYCP